MVKIHSFLFVVWHFLTGISWAMYAKRKMPGDDGDPTRRLRKNLADLFLSNAVSGSRAHTLFDDADVSGCKHMKDLVKCGNKGIAKNNSAGTSPISSSSTNIGQSLMGARSGSTTPRCK